MSPVQAVNICLRKYATFSGRASRSEFGWFAGLFISLSFSVFWLVEIAVSGRGLVSARAMLAFQIAFIVPFLAVIWRRCHDLGRHGAIGMIPFAILAASLLLAPIEAHLVPSDLPGLVSILFGTGGFLLSGVAMLIWLTCPSQSGPNSYGPNPNEVPT
jgi:uncharacterized membrane protein YhaH (DUF805 family)